MMNVRLYARLPGREDLSTLLSAGLVFFLAHEFAFLFPAASGTLMAVWPATGLGLAAMLLNSRDLWPAIGAVLYATGVLADALSHRALSACIGFPAVNVLQCLLSAWLITHFCGQRQGMRLIRDVLVLLAAALGLNALTALLGAALASLSSPASLWVLWRAWWIANGLGILLFAPLVLAWAEALPRRRELTWGRAAEFTLCLAVAMAVAWEVASSGGVTGIFKPYMMVTLLAWPALRFGVRGVTAALVLYSAAGLLCLARTGIIPGAAAAFSRDAALPMQMFIGIAAVMGYLLAVSYSQAQSTERSAREGAARLAALANHLPNAVVYRVVRSVDNAMKFEFVSEQSLAINGIAAEDLMRDSSLFYRQVVPEDRPLLALNREKALRSVGMHNALIRIRRPDQQIVWLRLISASQLLEDGSICWEGIQLDVTEGVRREEEDAALRLRMAQTQKMELIGRLAGGVAHDINNMLGVIIGYTDLALRRPELSDGLRADLAEARKAAGRSADLTRQLLAFARKQIIEPKLLELNQTVTGVLTMLRRLIGENITVEWSPGEGLWTVCVDPSQIDQILANLCVNSRDAIGGGGKISIATRNASVDWAFAAAHADSRPGDFVVLAVTDNGSGMEPDTLTHIFEPFFTTKEAGTGTGLGLATLYGIVLQNKGFVTVSSAPGQGSRFEIYLPRHLALALAAQPAPAPSAVPRAHLKTCVLLAEDEPTMLNLTRVMLESAGYWVLAAGTPHEAVRLALSYDGQIELLLTDVIMPEMHGRELAADLKVRFPSMRTLFMSGYTADVFDHQGVSDLGPHFLQKPFSLESLVAKVRETLA